MSGVRMRVLAATGNGNGIMSRLLSPALRFVRPQSAVSKPQTPDESKRYDNKKERNEKLTIWNKFVQFGICDIGTMIGTYKQRLDGDDSRQNPFYNPQAATLAPDSGLLTSLQHYLLMAGGMIGNWFSLDVDYATFINDPALRAEQNRSGDYWSSAGNGSRYLSGVIFARLFDDKEILFKNFIAKAQKLRPELVPLLEEYASASLATKTKGRDVFFKAAMDYTWSLRLVSLQHFLRNKLFRPAESLLINSIKIARGETAHIGFPSPLAGIKSGYHSLKTRYQERLAGPEKYLKAPVDHKNWVKFSERIVAAQTPQELMTLCKDRLKLGIFLMTASENTEDTYATATSQLFRQKNLGKIAKTVAPLVNSVIGPFLALPIMGLYHISALIAAYLTNKSNIPKIIKSLNNPEQAPMIKEMLTNVGLYTGMAIQSAYALWHGSGELFNWLGDGSIEFSHVYDELIQAKQRLPWAIEWSARLFMITPPLVALELETKFLNNVLKQKKQEKNNLDQAKQGPMKKNITFHAVGVVMVFSSLVAAFYMANTMLIPLATAFTILSATLSFIQFRLKNGSDMKNVATEGRGLILGLLAVAYHLLLPVKSLRQKIERKIANFVVKKVQQFLPDPIQVQSA